VYFGAAIALISLALYLTHAADAGHAEDDHERPKLTKKNRVIDASLASTVGRGCIAVLRCGS